MEILSLIRINKTIYDKMKKKTLSYGEYEAVTNGLLRIVRNEGITLPEKATNGDVIKALFPEIKDWEIPKHEELFGHYVDFGDATIKNFSLEWWNAPYRGINDKRGEI